MNTFKETIEDAIKEAEENIVYWDNLIRLAKMQIVDLKKKLETTPDK